MSPAPQGVIPGRSGLDLAACGEEPPPPTETVRAIRTVTVAEPASGKSRRFSGVVEAASTSSLSFEVPGNVQEVKVDVGERVSQGQVLATLDDQTYRLNVEAAEATVGRAEVELADADGNPSACSRSPGETGDWSASRCSIRPRPTMMPRARA